MIHAPVQDRTLNVKEEIARMKEFSERLCADKQAALEFFVKYGFLTPDGKEIAERYR